MSIYEHFDTPDLDSLEEEIASLRESRDLLIEIWRWYGPYGPRAERTSGSLREALLAMSMPEELHLKMQQHFHFDDSE